MKSPLSNGSGRLGELPVALRLLAAANIGEESIAESWPVGKVRFLETFALSRCRARAGTRQHFPRPATFDPQACSNHAFGISQAVQPGKLRLIFAREVATGIPGFSGSLNGGFQV